MKNIQEIQHEGKNILVHNYRGLRGEALFEHLKGCTRHLKNYPANNVLVLVDFSETYIDENIMTYLQSEESRQAARKAERMAIVGVSGLKKIFLNTYNAVTGSQARACADLESAKRYLVS